MQKLFSAMTDATEVRSDPSGFAWPKILAYIRQLEKEAAKWHNRCSLSEERERMAAALNARYRDTLSEIAGFIPDACFLCNAKIDIAKAALSSSAS